MTQNQHIGILGGGQLARMMLLSAYPLGLNISVLAAQQDDPAAQVCASVQVGPLHDEKVLRGFLSDLDVVTFESEFVDTALLARCLPARTTVFPSLAVIENIQDRLTQKQLLDRLKIPTCPWLPVESVGDLKQAAAKFPQGLVLKQRRHGYDGYGTFIVRDPRRDLDPSLLDKSTHGFIAEAFVKFKRELAISFVRSGNGAFVSLPLVESLQVNARCFSVHGPTSANALPKLIKAFKRLMQSLEYQGILAVELFATEQGLVVNELAPRVHNSAHYSLDGLACDQFEYHWRAGLNLPLPQVELLRPGFAMVNLLGEGHAAADQKLSHAACGHLHWYGKRENRQGRKLGHINVLAPTGTQALKRAVKWRKEFKL